MASQKLLIVLVMHIFEDQETSDIVNEHIFVIRMVENSVRVLSIVANGVFQLYQLLL